MQKQITIGKKEVGSHLSERKGTFFFDPEDRIYSEHFPGNPIVPGSIIVNSFYQVSQQAGLIFNRLSVDKFRFKKFLSPGKFEYRIFLKEGSVDCELYDGKQVVVKGSLRR